MALREYGDCCRIVCYFLQWSRSEFQLINSFYRLIDFFRFFSKDFQYNTGVASIRAGGLKKDAKGWQNDVSYAVPIQLYKLTLPDSCQPVDIKMPENGTGYASRYDHTHAIESA